MWITSVVIFGRLKLVESEVLLFMQTNRRLSIHKVAKGTEYQWVRIGARGLHQEQCIKYGFN